jgi:hypothetical protein
MVCAPPSACPSLSPSLDAAAWCSVPEIAWRNRDA